MFLLEKSSLKDFLKPGFGQKEMVLQKELCVVSPETHLSLFGTERIVDIPEEG